MGHILECGSALPLWNGAWLKSRAPEKIGTVRWALWEAPLAITRKAAQQRRTPKRKRMNVFDSPSLRRGREIGNEGERVVATALRAVEYRLRIFDGERCRSGALFNETEFRRQVRSQSEIGNEGDWLDRGWAETLTARNSQLWLRNQMGFRSDRCRLF